MRSDTHGMPSPNSFASLLRASKFVALGDFRNKVIQGTVCQVFKDDLYVDLGLKFNAVVKRPRENGKLYVRGSVVRVKLLDYEITDRFIGADRDLSLFEADAILLGLDSTPIGKLTDKRIEISDSKTRTKVPSEASVSRRRGRSRVQAQTDPQAPLETQDPVKSTG